MKNKLAIIISVFMIFSLSACSKTQTTAGNSAGVAESTSQTVTTEAVTSESTENDYAAASTSSDNQKVSDENTSADVLQNSGNSDGTSVENKADTDTGSNKTSNILVVYFSVTGTTKGVAEKIADGIGADIYEIVPETPYTDADINYNDNNSRSTIEMNDADARPAISGSIDNMEQYDIIFLGYPIWWGQAPRILSTFVESYDLTGKTVVPFCTSASSDIGSSATNLEKLTSGADWLAGKRFSSGDSADTIMEWVNALGLTD